MARDDRKRGCQKGSQPPKAQPEPQTEPVDLFSEDDLDAFLQSPATAPPAPDVAPPPLEEPTGGEFSGLSNEAQQVERNLGYGRPRGAAR